MATKKSKIEPAGNTPIRSLRVSNTEWAEMLAAAEADGHGENISAYLRALHRRHVRKSRPPKRSS